MCSLPHRKSCLSWAEGKQHRAWGSSIACPWRRMGKMMKMAITPCCSTHSGWAVPLNQGTGFLHLTPVKMHHYLNNKRSIWTQDIRTWSQNCTCLWSFQVIYKHLNYFTAHTWMLAMGCLYVPDGHQQASPVDSPSTSLGIKAVPAGSAFPEFIGGARLDLGNGLRLWVGWGDLPCKYLFLVGDRS